MLNESALQLLVADAESWELTAKTWEEAYNEQRRNYERYVRDSKEQLRKIDEAVAKERSAWERKLRRARTEPGIGIFGGYGVNGWTIGVGIVWRVM